MLALNTEEFMADRIVVYWRDIPAQVIIKKGRQTAKRELSLRFTEAIGSPICSIRELRIVPPCASIIRRCSIRSG